MKLRALLMSGGMVAGFLFAGACAQAPELPCSIARGSHAARFDLVTGDPGSVCGSLTAARVGMQKFYPNGPGKTGSLAVKYDPRLLDNGGRTDTNPDTEPYALGLFSTETPEADDFCRVPTLEAGVVDLAATAAGLPDGGVNADGGPPAQEALRREWTWSEMKVVTTPGAPGTQWGAQLTYTINDCTATYNVAGIWPYRTCTTDLNCDPLPPTDGGRPSGINPKFPVQCVSGICVLSGDVAIPAE